MKSPKFSMVLCTRNPRADYIARTLAGIRAQTVSAGQWELIAVDSSSSPALEQRPLPWPEGVRFVRVDEPGVFRARMAGVFAALGEWIVFVDDDNVLDRDYLENAAGVIDHMPEIDLFCGRISGVFETAPPDWLKAFYRQLAIVDFPADSWAREWDPGRVPCWTAGMCIRKDVAVDHFSHAQHDPFVLDIKTRAEDVHLVMETLKRGHLAGLFRSLHLCHLIPADRMTTAYLKKISAETGYNMTRIRCRDSRCTVRDLLRPLKNAVLSLRHGFAPRGRIARATAWGDFCGAWDALLRGHPSRASQC